MKAVVLAGLVGHAIAGGGSCLIPAVYTANTATSACTGPATGYSISGFCQSATQGTSVTEVAAGSYLAFPLTTATATQFQTAANTATGCRVGSFQFAQSTAANFVANPAGDAAGCAGANGFGFLGGLQREVKGVTITCDAGAGYYPSAGLEGSLICFDSGTAGAGPPVAAATNQGPVQSQVPLAAAEFAPPIGTPELTPAVAPTWASPASTLRCELGCVIPAPFCQGAGVLNAALMMQSSTSTAGSGAVVVAGACRMRPSTTAVFSCRTAGYTNTFTATCTSVAGAAGTFGFNTVPDCLVTDGAVLAPVVNSEAPTGTMAAGTLSAFSGVSSTSTAVAAAAAAQFGGIFLRQTVTTTPFVAGSGRRISVTGCEAVANRNACVQDAINWWRCRNIGIDSGSSCYANGVLIACPTHALGWRCESSSKKGLLGLLGLLGLIPLLLCSLLLCCLLGLCRRKKTESDVHFATFDPHAAPVAGSVVAPATAVVGAPAYGAPTYGVPTAAF